MIDGTDIKETYLKVCDIMIENIVNSMYSYILKISEEKRKEIQFLVEQVSRKAEGAEALVEIEKLMDRIRTKDAKQMENEFKDIMLWLKALHNNNFKCDEELKAMLALSEQVQTLMTRVDREEQNIRKAREDIETNLKKRKEEFQKDIDSLSNDIESLKTKYDNDFQVDDANKEIERYDIKVGDYFLSNNNECIDKRLYGEDEGPKQQRRVDRMGTN